MQAVKSDQTDAVCGICSEFVTGGSWFGLDGLAVKAPLTEGSEKLQLHLPVLAAGRLIDVLLQVCPALPDLSDISKLENSRHIVSRSGLRRLSAVQTGFLTSSACHVCGAFTWVEDDVN